MGSYLAGRLRAIRLMGKIIFAHIEDGSGRFPAFILRVNELGQDGPAAFPGTVRTIGDFIEAAGT